MSLNVELQRFTAAGHSKVLLICIIMAVELRRPGINCGKMNQVVAFTISALNVFLNNGCLKQ